MIYAVDLAGTGQINNHFFSKNGMTNTMKRDQHNYNNCENKPHVRFIRKLFKKH